jgi:hypothetical protein
VLDEEFALRRERDRPIDVRCDRGAADRGGTPGLLGSGAASDEGGSAGRVALRVIAQRSLGRNQANDPLKYTK